MPPEQRVLYDFVKGKETQKYKLIMISSIIIFLILAIVFFKKEFSSHNELYLIGIISFIVSSLFLWNYYLSLNRGIKTNKLNVEVIKYKLGKRKPNFDKGLWKGSKYIKKELTIKKK